MTARSRLAVTGPPARRSGQGPPGSEAPRAASSPAREETHVRDKRGTSTRQQPPAVVWLLGHWLVGYVLLSIFFQLFFMCFLF